VSDLSNGLATDGFVVVDQVFTHEYASLCRQEIESLELQRGEIAQGGTQQKSTSRTDVRAFLKLEESSSSTTDKETGKGQQTSTPALQRLAQALDALRVQMNGVLQGNGALTDRSSVMVAKYSAGTGTGYVKHRDSVQGGGRKVTALCYFGDEDVVGGELCVYAEPEEGAGEEEKGGEGEEDDWVVAARIAPVPGRMILFHSHRLHEVLPIEGGDRYAMTSWWTNQLDLTKELLQEERMKALRKLAFKRLRRNLTQRSEGSRMMGKSGGGGGGGGGGDADGEV
jgi:Rps23 Pro-64 3,4-dihydroxylase Tpa1-like proline 4-hydroxylase